jgi:DNA-binding transcriptional MerR regulator
MSKHVLTLQDLAAQSGIPAARLAEWTKLKLLKPDGYGEKKALLFSADALESLAYVQRLADLGYATDEILKIVKKVGLPRDRRGKKKAAAKDRFLTVGSLAERSGVSPRTIKHWEDKGIIEPDMRTEGGFRLYSEAYVFLCQLIRDLQLFGYSLEEVKAVSDDVRTLLAIETDLEAHAPAAVEKRLAAMLEAIKALSDRMKLLEEGIERWRELLKKKKKDILALQAKNRKRGKAAKEASDA